MVTSDPVGLVLKSSSRFGISGTASGNSSRKKSQTSSSVLVVAKLRGPSNSQKSVQVNEPSGFGSAIIIKLLRGQMWSAFFSIRHEPSGPGGLRRLAQKHGNHLRIEGKKLII